MTNNLKKIKVVFLIIVFFLMTGIIGSSITLRDSGEFRSNKIAQKINALRYFLFYTPEGTSRNLTAMITSAFENPKENVSSEGMPAKSVPVFVYHGIVDVADRFGMTLGTFEDQLFALKKAGYESITLEDLIAFRKGEKTLPAKPFLLTFDDGRVDSYLMADPLLSLLNYTAVMFVATEDSIPVELKKKSTFYISSYDIQKMLSSKRWEIGSHAIQETGGHIAINNVGGVGTFLSNKKWLTSLNRLENDKEYSERISREIVDSKKILEKTLNTPIVSFSYPFSDYGQQSLNNEADALSLIRTLIQENYQIAFKQVWPEDSQFTYNYPDTDPSFLKRIEVPPAWNGAELISFLEKSSDKTLPYTTSFTESGGWKRTWGEVSTEKNALMLTATPQGTGGSLFLDGSYLWKDYLFTTNLTLKKGESYTLMARYKDGENYAACSFSSVSDYVRVENYVANARTLLAEGKGKPVVRGEEYTAGIEVVDNSIRCYQDGKMVATSPALSPFLSNGGIGFKVWSPHTNDSSLLVSSVAVEKTE